MDLTTHYGGEAGTPTVYVVGLDAELVAVGVGARDLTTAGVSALFDTLLQDPR